MPYFSVPYSWHTYTHYRSHHSSFSGQNHGHILLKNVLFNFTFQHEGQLYANWLLFILIFYYKDLLFQLFRRGIRIRITIPTSVQNSGIKSFKMAAFF